MQIKKLGDQGLKVSKLGLSLYADETSDQEDIYIIQHAIELGINFFDLAAAAYSYRCLDEQRKWAYEILVGQTLSLQRNQVIIATTFTTMRTHTEQGTNNSASYVKSACEATLKRLGTDYIDLYYMDQTDSLISLEETVEAMAKLVQTGQVRYLGLSGVTPEQLETAHAVHPITAVRAGYSLGDRSVEQGILQICRKLGVGFVSSYPIGLGSLKMFEAIRDIAEKKGCIPVQLALAWFYAQGENLIPISGTKKLGRFQTIAQGLDISLTIEDLHRLDEISSNDGVH